MSEHWEIGPRPVDAPESAALLRAYFEELVRTYWQRPATPAEVDAALADEPSTDLAPPDGIFLVARDGDRPVGCVGLKVMRPGYGRLTRMFVHSDARASGGAARLIGELERRAATFGVHTVQLDTRHDRVAARRLYARVGYTEVGKLWDDKYAEHWFEKQLTTSGPVPDGG